MQRRYALFIGVSCIEFAAVEQLLDGSNLSKSCQLHEVFLDGQGWFFSVILSVIIILLGRCIFGRGGHCDSALQGPRNLGFKQVGEAVTNKTWSWWIVRGARPEEETNEATRQEARGEPSKEDGKLPGIF